MHLGRVMELVVAADDGVVGPDSGVIGAGSGCGCGSGFRSFCGDMSSFRAHRVSHRVSVFGPVPPASAPFTPDPARRQDLLRPRRTPTFPLPHPRRRRSMTDMADTWIRLLGPPRIESAGTAPRQPRGRKAWAVLAYLALQPGGTGRSRTAALLFPDAEDPLGALRWNLSELRRTLGAESVGGDPLRLVLPAGWNCDVLAALQPAGDADPRTFDGQLLEGLAFEECPAFESWLEDQRHRLENAVLTLLYEASLAALAAGRADDAVDLATRALHLDPFNADCHAVLIKALHSLGEYRRAREQAEKCRELYRRELGLDLPVEVRRALADAAPAADPGMPASSAAVRSYLDAAEASLSAGSVDRGLEQLRLAAELAQRTGDHQLLAESLVTLSGALIHQAGGRGAEVADLLHGR